MAFLPAAGGRLGWARGALGALIGIAVAGVLTRFLAQAGLPGMASPGLPWLVAPLGAAAVLVFAVPASPLAQPWPVIGGNLISAAVGLAAGHWIAAPWLAASLGVGCAIALMAMARCLHPPGGACALLCALGAGANGWGWSFLLMPLAPNVLALAASGWLYNRLTGHPWPHHPAPPPVLPRDTWAGTYDIADLDAVLADWDEVLDIDREDLDALFRALERRVQARWESARQ
ncbi:HPP family protein [Novosphingobium sp. EMRT-2]|uniref:HPP family protein n=1 Tax=Novosphingobium sp. EMRT-2 TaxID=2571749 RepID=UPI0010BD94F4|nr:HPP family protein [Novosphingobium sp. EMRT-2]QCI93848.1 HPP family protein [Novosphingobium sp. EMRT-2]